MSAPDAPRIPGFLRALAARASTGDAELIDLGTPVPAAWSPRRGAVLLLIAGDTLDGARIVVEERGHGLRSQPGQFSLPGGGVEQADADDAAAALREAEEEVGLDPEEVHVIGSFAPIPMPWREYEVRPVLAWSPHVPDLHAAQPREVERVVWAPLIGPGSLSDPAVRRTALLDGRDVGTAYDLPEDAFVWGFTAYLLEAVLRHVVEVPGPQGPRTEIPPLRRMEGSTRPRGPHPGGS
ncbi:NUDIX domain-containing protein [Brachybacterium phenoliresistens]|uniref:NUDIX hydrolase n=1 Tax=Brachybacterium phenoliresistens TaxID=396014 RepID=Z9JP87_9MICO|nr:NUDIX domain-containing protein [Brachybacterium phenoliresistens]EWS80235.1 NUDIX hydrolase [Brachybacterium phenoliresistens]